MIFDRIRRKTTNPSNGSGGLELDNLPQEQEAVRVDETISQIDSALNLAKGINQSKLPRVVDDCNCFGVRDYGGF